MCVEGSVVQRGLVWPEMPGDAWIMERVRPGRCCCASQPVNCREEPLTVGSRFTGMGSRKSQAETLVILKTSFFLSSFRFPAKLGGRGRGFPYTPYSHTGTTSPSSACPQEGTSVIVDEPMVACVISQSPQHPLGRALGVVHVVGLDKYMKTCIHQYGVLQDSY